jgi:mono/diheme cytochrome c family protein
VHLRRALLLALALVGCGEPQRELREWQASDHQAPAAPQAGDARAAPPEADGSEEVAPEEMERRAATALFGSLCASCHGAGGRGDGPERPPVASVPDLSSPEWQDAHTDQEIAAAIRDGRGAFMPAFGDRLRPAGIEALARHVRRLAGRAPVALGEPASEQAPAEPAPAPAPAPAE